MTFFDQVYYRIWQFWQAANSGSLTLEDWEEIRQVLSPSETQLFECQTTGGQQHSYRVMQTLRTAGHDNHDLLAAALLHDVGKYKVRAVWWDRPVVVLGEALVPTNAKRWSDGDIEGWNRPFVVKAHHPEWGAEAAAAKGSTKLTVALIRRHQESEPTTLDNEEDKLLAILQWSDNLN